MKLGMLGAAAAMMVASCADDASVEVGTRSYATGACGNAYIVHGGGKQLGSLAQAVGQAGGSTVETVAELGLVLATSCDGDFLTKVQASPEVVYAAPDPVADWLGPLSVAALDQATVQAAAPIYEPYGFLQWAHQAIDSPGAWSLGASGQGVRVAVVDTGIDDGHYDLKPNLNMALSTSLVPGEGLNQPGPKAFHGTHVAGIIAAAKNYYGVVGVAPEAELVAIKALSSQTGVGSFSDIIRAILYAANNGADVINLSLGTGLRRSGYVDVNATPYDLSDDLFVGADVVNHLINAVCSATTYARQKGAIVVASAGNEAADLSDTADLVALPASCPQVLSISATAPLGWIADPAAALDVPASYSNFGQGIDFAAPGGTSDYSKINPSCTAYGMPCGTFDMVLSTCPGGWCWAAGTSMAAAHVSGVAALIRGQDKGLDPSEVKEVLIASADDLGKPGKDPAYGKGRVNARQAALLSGPKSIHVQLVWNTPADPNQTDMTGTDLDLHLLHEDAQGEWGALPYDCFSLNAKPSWGDPASTEDDPRLDMDDTNGAGPENINIDRPEPGHTYHVGVNYYDDHGFGASLATIRVYVRGELLASWENVLLQPGQFWYASTLTVSADGDVGFATVNRITPGYPQDFSPYQVVISEILANPAATADSAGEWVEVYNAGSSAVDLQGWTLRDDDPNYPNVHVISSSVPIPAGAYAVLAINGQSTTNGGVDADYAYGSSFLLGNSGDEVVLEDEGGRLVDRVAYTSGWGITSGASFQLIDPALDNNLRSSWCVSQSPWSGSAGDRGTPGAPNDCP